MRVHRPRNTAFLWRLVVAQVVGLALTLTLSTLVSGNLGSLLGAAWMGLVCFALFHFVEDASYVYRGNTAQLRSTVFLLAFTWFVGDVIYLRRRGAAT